MSEAAAAGVTGEAGAPARGRRRAAQLAWAIPGAALLASCGWLGLMESTETRYAEIAREMLASGDWLVPRLDGISHFHKPPLAYWLSAGGMAAVGLNEWGARLGVALAGGFVLWCTARLARAHAGAGPRLEALAPLVMASTVMFFVLSRQLGSDIFLAATVAGFHLAYAGPRTRRGLWPFVALAAGFMAKGPVVLVTTVLPVLLAAAWARDRDAARPLASGRGWLLFGAMALPWYLIVVARTPGLMHYFLVHQLWHRFTTTTHGRGGPSYYFAAVLAAGALPWTCAVGAELWRAVRAGRPRRDFSEALLVTWAVAPAVFFSFSGSKLPAYLLPVMPAVALLASRALVGAGRALTVATGGTMMLMAAALEAGGPFGLARLVELDPPAPVALPIAVHVAALALAWAGLWCISRRPVASAALGFAGFLALLWTARPYDGAIGSPRALARLLSEQHAPGEPVVEYAHFNGGLPFYLREPVRLMEVERELYFEEPGSVARAFVTRGGLQDLVARHGRVWVLAPADRVGDLDEELGLRVTIVARWKRESLALLQRP